MNKNETKTLAIIFKTGFTFKADAHWNSYRQATVVLNSLERRGFIFKEDGAYKLTETGREAHLWPHSI